MIADPALSCRLDGCTNLEVVYEGVVRDGLPGSTTNESFKVLRCPATQVAYLHPFAVLNYESDEYRQKYNATGEVEAYYRVHDAIQVANLRMIEGLSVRDKTVADYGCGAGAFLDLMRGTAARTLGVEPYETFRANLRRRGHGAFAHGSDLLASEYAGRVDVAVCFHVIEHTNDPRAFLREIHAALLPGGVACVATPNADDFLLELAGEPYRQFFYRTAHLWYFSGASLAQLASEAGFRVRRIGYVQEYDLANAMLWLREGMPRGNGKIPWIDAAVDAAWRAQLEAKGLASTVYVILER